MNILKIWDWVRNLFRDKQLKTAMVMYKYNGRSVMFCYSEYDNKILSDGDKDEIEMTIKKKLNFGRINYVGFNG